MFLEVRMIGEMQAFPEIEILEGEGYGQTQYWLNIYIGDTQRSVWKSMLIVMFTEMCCLYLTILIGGINWLVGAKVMISTE